MRQAYQTSMIDVVQRYGYKLKYEYDIYKVEGVSGGLYIWQNGLGWYHHSEEAKGNNVEFLRKYCGVDKITDAIRILLNEAHITPTIELQINNKPRPPKGQIQLPEKFPGKWGNLYWYLINQRCISDEVVYKCVNDGTLYQDARRNVVFCGKDHEGNIKYATLRGTYQAEGREPYKGEVFNSDKRFGFSINGTSDRLYVFEAPIDAMSHATLCKLSGLDWQRDSRLALGGTADPALMQYLNDHPNIRQIVLCLDNDYCRWDNNKHQFFNVGQAAVRRHYQTLKEKYAVGRSKPPLPYKDFNDYLVGVRHPGYADELREKALNIFTEHDAVNLYEQLFPEQAPAEPEPALEP